VRLLRVRGHCTGRFPHDKARLSAPSPAAGRLPRMHQQATGIPKAPRVTAGPQRETLIGRIAVATLLPVLLTAALDWSDLAIAVNRWRGAGPT
jgi:hypothetical protein